MSVFILFFDPLSNEGLQGVELPRIKHPIRLFYNIKIQFFLRQTGHFENFI